MGSYLAHNWRGKLWGWLGSWFGAAKSYTVYKPTNKEPIYTLGCADPRAFSKCKSCVNDTKAKFTAKYNRTYNSFGGVDIHFSMVPHGSKAYLGFPTADKVVLDKWLKENPQKKVQEVVAIAWDEKINVLTKTPRMVEGTIIATFFDREPIGEDHYKGKDFVLIGCNEYGHRVEIRLKKAKITQRSMGISIDDLMIEITYKFTAETVEYSKADYVPPAPNYCKH